MPDNLANARVNCANIPELNLSVFWKWIFEDEHEFELIKKKLA
jgi:hypothetical protein